jgi:hypothetical protein
MLKLNKIGFALNVRLIIVIEYFIWIMTNNL